MKLSIVTINYNDAVGLRKTLESVAAQKLHPNLLQKGQELVVEHIIVDGGSTDESVDIIKEYVLGIEELGLRTEENGLRCEVKWVSEKDNGVYNAMNKGIRLATGDFIQILNSGDILANKCVIQNIYERIEEKGLRNEDLIYGNMIRQRADGTIEGKSGEVPYSLLQYFSATLNHDCCWIRRSLFVPINKQSSISNQPCYGLYDENLKIVSDWKWFLQAIGLGHMKPVYVDIDMTIFDTTGISERNLALRNEERRMVLEEVLPPAVLADYDKYAFPMHQIDRLKKHHLYGLVYFVERVLFKLEKWHILK